MNVSQTRSIGGAIAIALLSFIASGCQDDNKALLEELRANQAAMMTQLRGIKVAQQTLIDNGVRMDLSGKSKKKLGKIAIKDSPKRGVELGKVVVVEYADFGCPYCTQLSPISTELVEAYPGEVTFVFKHFPLTKHKNARLAAMASWAASKQGKFWEMHDRLFAAQGRFEMEALLKYAEEIGLDRAKFEADLGSQEAQFAVTADKVEGKRLGVRTTPSFVVNGEPLRQPTAEGVRAAVDMAVAQAREAAGAGEEPTAAAEGQPAQAPAAEPQG